MGVWSRTLKHRIASNELNCRLGIEFVTDVIRRSRLRWFGHVEHKDSEDWVSACRSFEVMGMRSRGRGRRLGMSA